MTTYTHENFFTNVLPTLGNTFTAEVEATLDGCNKNATYTFTKTQGGNIQAVVPDFDGQPIDDSNPDYWKNYYTGTFKINTKGLGMSHVLVDFLTSKLKTESNRERFNSFFKDILRAMPESDGSIGFVQRFEKGVCSVRFQDLNETYQEKIIRTCLSRVNYTDRVPSNPSVLVCFGNLVKTNTNLSDILYLAFDYPLRNGKPLDTALQALHDKMLELVPEYKEFIKNNK